MKVLRRIFSQWHRFVLCALLLSIFWAWIYSAFVADTSQDKKITVFVNACNIKPRKLALYLDEELPEGIKMAKVYDFSYSIFPSGNQGDIYIVNRAVLERTLDESPESVAPIPDPGGREAYVRDGTAYGLKVFDAETGGTGEGRYIIYAPSYGLPTEDYYICIGAESLHYAQNEGALDNAAWPVVLRLLGMDE